MVRTLARGIPKRYLEQIAREDPSTIDEAVLATARKALEVYSDDACPVALCTYDDNGQLTGYDIYGNRESFPSGDQAQLS